MKNRIKLFAIVALLLSIALLFSSCTIAIARPKRDIDTEKEEKKSDGDTKTEDEKEEDKETDKKDEKDETDDKKEPVVDTRPINPLTGEHTDYAVTNRPVAVMFNNAKASLPQYGLSEADIIYEAIAEGNITRIMALYLDASHVKNFGSIRGMRLYLLKIAMGHDAVIVHSGGNEDAKGFVKDNGIVTLDGSGYRGAYFYRDQQRADAGYKKEHTLFITGESLAEMYDKTLDNKLAKDTTKHFTFAEEEFTPLKSKKAVDITVSFVPSFSCEFKYDETTKEYVKYQYGKPQTDELYSKDISTKNVIVLYTNLDLKDDDSGEYNLDFSNGGDGMYFTNGVCVPINWKKLSDTTQFSFRYDSDGKELRLNPGKTYVCIISDTGSSVFYK